MAVDIDTVYQTVLAIANKEQRGYITPQEFNLIANQAQMSILEQYFYDMNQFDRLPGNDMEYSDPLDVLEEKLSTLRVMNATPAVLVDGDVNVNSAVFLPPLYKLGTVRLLDGTIVEPVQGNKEFSLYNSNPLTTQSNAYPVYVRYFEGATNQERIRIFPDPGIGNNIFLDYIRMPARANWGYVVVNEKALFNPGPSQNFELHSSEEAELVTKILILSGIIIKSPELHQMGSFQERKTTQQEKS